MAHILIIEDEAGLVALLKYNLEKQGHRVASVSDGALALDTIKTQKPDLILLDWMLPHVPGIEICKQIRQHHQLRHIPLIMLTARSDEADKVQGLLLGADDYLTKPFSVPELLARIQALLRRIVLPPAKPALKIGDLTLDFEKKRVLRAGKIIHLGPTEFRLLQCLMEKPAVVLSREVLLKLVWGEAIHVEERTVDVHIKRLRRALTIKGLPSPIRTVRGSGYALNEQ